MTISNDELDAACANIQRLLIAHGEPHHETAMNDIMDGLFELVENHDPKPRGCFC